MYINTYLYDMYSVYIYIYHVIVGWAVVIDVVCTHVIKSIIKSRLCRSTIRSRVCRVSIYDVHWECQKLHPDHSYPVPTFTSEWVIHVGTSTTAPWTVQDNDSWTIPPCKYEMIEVPRRNTGRWATNMQQYAPNPAGPFVISTFVIFAFTGSLHIHIHLQIIHDVYQKKTWLVWMSSGRYTKVHISLLDVWVITMNCDPSYYQFFVGATLHSWKKNWLIFPIVLHPFHLKKGNIFFLAKSQTNISHNVCICFTSCFNLLWT